MPTLEEVEISEEKVYELIKQLDFKKKMALIRKIAKERDYRDNFYAYTEDLAKQYNIPDMTEEELADFLHSYTDD
jgi:hypothetical protein